MYKVFNKYQETRRKTLLGLSTTYRNKLLTSAEGSTSILKAGIEEFKFNSFRDWTKLKDCLMNELSIDSKIRIESKKYSKRQKKHFEKLIKIFDFHKSPAISSRCENLLKAPFFFDQELLTSKSQNQVFSFCEKHDNYLEQIIDEVSTNFLTNHNSLLKLIPDDTKSIKEIFAFYGKIQSDEFIKLIKGFIKS